MKNRTMTVVASVSACAVFGLLMGIPSGPSAARLEVSYDPFIGNPFGRIFRFGMKLGF